MVNCNKNQCSCWFDGWFGQNWGYVCTNHDKAYKAKRVSRWTADNRLFRGVSRHSMLMAVIMWVSVRLFGWIPWNGLGMDKILHFVVSAVLTVGITLVTYLSGNYGIVPLMVGVTATLSIGILKEIVYDLLLDKGMPDLGAMIAGTAGVLFGAMVIGSAIM